MTRRTVRTILCPCGISFETKEPTARYCSQECRKRYGRFGQTHGQVEPRQFGVWRRGGMR